MINSVKNVLRIQAAMSCNRFLFWLKKLPLIRRLFPDSLYGAVNAKQRLMAAVEVLKVLSYFAGTSFSAATRPWSCWPTR